MMTHLHDTKFVQAVAGTLLYYARAVDATILTALSVIATEQANPTQRTMETKNNCQITVHRKKKPLSHTMQAK